jgi:hypothetical protein
MVLNYQNEFILHFTLDEYDDTVRTKMPHHES